MDKKIKLSEILENKRNEAFFIPEMDYQLEAMKEACKQILTLAVENAKLIHFTDNWGDPAVALHKESILDTINQIF